MVHLIKKKVKGRIYYLLQENIWKNGKSQRAWQIYLGPLDKLREAGYASKPEKLEFTTLEYGADLALYEIAKKLELTEIIEKFTSKKRDQGLTVGEYILLSVINRCVSPCSKNRLGKWFENSVLTKYFQIEPKVLNSQTYWNHFLYINEETIEKIETELTAKVFERYNLGLDCVLYDPTNFYTYIQDHDSNSLPEKGYSKEKRFDLNQINLSLFCLRDGGIPLMHQLYSGNIQDASHFKRVIPKFIERMVRISKEIKEITLIFDKGNHSKEAFEFIDGERMNFIASVRPSTQKDLLEIPIDSFTTITLQSTGKQVKYNHVKREIYDRQRDVYIIFDPRHNIRVKKRIERKLARKLQNLNDFIKNKLNIKKWRDPENVQTKIKTILGKDMYDSIIKVEIKTKSGKLELHSTIDKVEMDKRIENASKNILFTNCESWSPEQVIRTFREQHVVENAFKQLKNKDCISFRPIFHYTDSSIRVHAFICVLALLLLSLLRLELSQQGINMSYFKILDVLKSIKLTKVFNKNNKLVFEKLNKIDTEAKKIMKIMDLKKYLPNH